MHRIIIRVAAVIAAAVLFGLLLWLTRSIDVDWRLMKI